MSGEDYCDNRVLYQKCIRALFEHTTDVQFIFENGDDTIKIPANRAVLSASSPVFNAMFNGELKEEGDVKITDASPEAFKEFLEFFYDSQVMLTTKNVGEVLKLADKYDVPDCLPVCSDFLKKNVAIDDVLWTLHLAVQFNLDDLKTYCEQMIDENCKVIFDKIGFVDGRWRVTSDNRLLDTEMENILPHVFAISKNIISKMPEESHLFPVTLATKKISWNSTVENIETTQFSLDKTMMLANIMFSNVCLQDEYFDRILRPLGASCAFEMYIKENSKSDSRDTKILRWHGIVIESYREERIELQPPIRIQPDCIYTIIMKSKTNLHNIVTHETFDLNSHIQIAPNVCITIYPNDQNHAHSLISRMEFKYDQNK